MKLPADDDSKMCRAAGKYGNSSVGVILKRSTVIAAHDNDGATEKVSVAADGVTEGLLVGTKDGVAVGFADGMSDGLHDGADVGIEEGAVVGFVDGMILGSDVGIKDGT